MATYIIKKTQLIEYVENKKAEKVFYDIVESLYNNNKFLNENLSRQKINQSVINNYMRKNLITPRVHEMLVKNNIINEKNEII